MSKIGRFVRNLLNLSYLYQFVLYYVGNCVNLCQYGEGFLLVFILGIVWMLLVHLSK